MTDSILQVYEKVEVKLPNICTVLTKGYLIQGLAFYRSLKMHTSRFWLWVLCVDDTSFNLLKKMNLANVTPISLEQIRTEKLAHIEQQRQIHEFCWTLKASFATYLFKNYNLDSLLYMDADLYFFKDIATIYSEWGEHSIYLTKLWLSPKSAKKAGKYSAGLIGFKSNRTGMKCLRSWRRKCLTWCYDRRENGLWGDQKYLDDWPRLFPGVKISENKGINVGPWNINRGYKVHSEGNVIYLDNRELVCYHFSGFEIIDEIEFELCNRKKLSVKAEEIYSAYVKEIQKAIAQIKSVDKSFMQRITGKERAKFYNHIIVKKRD